MQRLSNMISIGMCKTSLETFTQDIIFCRFDCKFLHKFPVMLKLFTFMVCKDMLPAVLADISGLSKWDPGYSSIMFNLFSDVRR